MRSGTSVPHQKDDKVEFAQKNPCEAKNEYNTITSLATIYIDRSKDPYLAAARLTVAE